MPAQESKIDMRLIHRPFNDEFILVRVYVRADFFPLTALMAKADEERLETVGPANAEKLIKTLDHANKRVDLETHTFDLRGSTMTLYEVASVHVGRRKQHVLSLARSKGELEVSSDIPNFLFRRKA